MKTTSLTLLACAFLFSIGVRAEPIDYEVSPTPSEETITDLSLLDSYLGAATDGQAISGSMRRVLNAALGELSLLLDTLISEDGYLTLDDGSTASIRDGDTVTMKPKGVPPTVIVRCNLLPPGNATIKKVIPSCKRVCSCTVKECNEPPICNTVPPQKVKK